MVGVVAVLFVLVIDAATQLLLIVGYVRLEPVFTRGTVNIKFLEPLNPPLCALGPT